MDSFGRGVGVGAVVWHTVGVGRVFQAEIGMGFDYIRTTDGREILAGALYTGCDRPVEITIGETSVTLGEFFHEVCAYLDSPDVLHDERVAFKQGLSRVTLQCRERSMSHVFMVPSQIPDSDYPPAPAFKMSGHQVSARELYSFVWYLLQKFPIDSFRDDVRFKFLRRYAPNFGNPREGRNLIARILSSLR
jgi:hypothetical protein